MIKKERKTKILITIETGNQYIRVSISYEIFFLFAPQNKMICYQNSSSFDYINRYNLYADIYLGNVNGHN